MKSDHAPEIEARAHWRRLVFISDLHLGPDAPLTTARFLQWLQADALQADALFILGDLFETWIGDDQLNTDPADVHHAVCAALACFASTDRFLGVMHGNRDFLLGSGFAQRTHAQLLADPSVLRFAGERILLTHGDALCTADIDYQHWRARCRDPVWQRQVLAQPLAARRQQAAALRAQSRAAQSRMETSIDADPVEASRWLRHAASPWMIHGHTHRPCDHWEDGRLRQVLSDWDLDTPASSVAYRAQVLWLDQGPSALAVHRQQLV